MDRPAYPTAPTSEQVDVYHGVTIADPFRPLEDVDAPATRSWIEAENRLTASVLAGVDSRNAIRSSLARVWDHPRASVPRRSGRRWFQLRNAGLQDQDVLTVAGGPGEPGAVLLDPNAMNAAGTTAMASIDPSASGELLAVALAEAGSDWWTWRVRRSADGAELPDTIRWAKFAPAAWTADDAGFYYGRYPEPPEGAAYDAPNLDMELRYHRIGTDAAEDPLVLSTPEAPDLFFSPEVTHDGTMLVVTVSRGTDPESRVWVADLPGPDGGAAELRIRRILDAADAAWVPLGKVGRELILQTDHGAPLRRIVAIDLDDPDRRRTIVGEDGDALEAAVLAGGRVAVVRLHDAHDRLSIHDLDGIGSTTVELPGISSVKDMWGHPDDPELFLAVERFQAPREILAVRVADGHVRELARPALSWEPDAFVTEQAFVASADGTRIPLFLTHRRDVVPDGDVPTLLYGYGGFQIPIGPTFKPEWLTWMERGGLLAVAALRGGSEYGTAWHDAGRLGNKQNVFDDFAACAAWLGGASGWSRPARIGVTGRSNGGLLVGALLTQRPDLIGAAIAEVGVMDMLRFHRFTVGWGWTSDYGSADDPEQFRWLLGYSPLHNCRPARYPATLVTTGDHDDRVVPGHSFKFAAQLQRCQRSDAPVLIRVDTDAGHGVGKPVGKLIDERADVLAFLELALRDSVTATTEGSVTAATRDGPREG